MIKKINLFSFISLGLLLSGCTAPTIQKKLNVTENLQSWDSTYGRGNLLSTKKSIQSLSSSCMKISISTETLDYLLERGSKVISSTKWTSGAQKFEYYLPNLESIPISEEEGICIGYSYIIEGPKKLLEKY